MLIPLGILASSGGAAGSYELIETVTLSSSQSSVTFSNLGNYSSTYQHLQIRATVRTSRSNDTGDDLVVRLNGDTASNYRGHELGGNGSTVFSGAPFGQNTFAYVGFVPTTQTTANVFSPLVMDILDPYEAKNKTLRSFIGHNTGNNNLIRLTSQLWMSTNSLTSVTFLSANSANFVQYSRFSLYGLKGA